MRSLLSKWGLATTQTVVAENREAFGADEDLVHPGLVLILPA